MASTVVRQDVIELTTKVNNSEMNKLQKELEELKKSIKGNAEEPLDGLGDTNAFSKLKQGFSSVSKSAKDFGKQIDSAASKIESKIFNLKNLVMGVLAGSTVKTAIDVVVDRQNITSQFEVLLGSAEKAQKRVQELTDFAGKTPFTRDEIFRASKQLQVFAGDALSTGDNLKVVGDIAAGTGQNFEDVALWVGRLYSAMKSKNKVGEMTSRLQEMGAISGEDRNEIEKLAGQVANGSSTIEKNWPQIEKVFGRFDGTMGKLSNNLGNMLTSLKSFATNNFFLPLGEGIAEGLQPAIQKFREFRKTNKADVDAMSGILKNFGKNVFVPLTNSIVSGVESVIKIVGALKDGVEGLEKIKGQNAFMDWIISAIQFVIKNKDTVISALEGIAIACAAIVAASKIQKLISSLKFLISPLGIISMLVTGLWILYKKNGGTVQDALNGIGKTLEWCKQRWEEIQTAIVGVIGVIAGLKLTRFITDMNNALIKIGLLKTGLTGLQKLQLGIGLTLLISGIALEAKGIMDTIKEKLNLNNLIEILGGTGLIVSGGAMIGKLFGSSLMGGAIAAIPAGMAAYFTGIWDAIKNGLNWLNGLLIPAGSAAAGAGIGAIIGSLGGPIGAGIGALIGLVVGLITDLVILVVQKWGEICKWFSESWELIKSIAISAWDSIKSSAISAWENIKNSAISAWDSIKNGVISAWDSIKSSTISAWNSLCTMFTNAVNWIKNTVINPVKNFFMNLVYFFVGLGVVIWEALGNILRSIGQLVINILSPIGEWIRNNLIYPIINRFVMMYNIVKNVVISIWNTICAVWGMISSWTYTNVIQPVVSFFVNLYNSIKNTIISILDTIYIVWGMITSWIYTNIIQPIINYFVTLYNIVKNVVISIWNTICAVWGMISSWTYTNIIQPVVSFFVNLYNSIKNIIISIRDTICTVWGMIPSWTNEHIVQPVISFFSEAWDNIKNAVDEVKEAITGAFQAAYDKVTEIWEKITGFFKGLWDGIKDTVNTLINKGKEALGVESDAKAANSNPTQHANGGLITKPHLGLVGEAGAEMIIPLSSGKRNRGIDLWEQAGSLLGVLPYANGGLVGSISKSATDPKSITQSYNGEIIITENAKAFWESMTREFENGINSMKGIVDQGISYIVAKITELPVKMGEGIKSSGNSLSQSLVYIWQEAVKAMANPVNKIVAGANHILKEFDSDKVIATWTPYAKGTDGHKGGNALVNDGRGAELVQMPNGRTFIPQGRNVFMPNAPKGMKVLPAEQTARLLGKKSPTFHYAGGIGDMELFKYIDDPEGLANKLKESVSYDGMKGFALSAGKGMVNTITSSMGNWLKKMFEEFGAKSLANYVTSGGVNQWESTVARALMMTGQYSAENVKRTLFQMQTESGGNPAAINLWDSNAKKGIPSKGLMQVIDPTFRAYAMPGFNTNIYDPLSNILASIRYAVSRYGSLARAYQGHGYANGVGSVDLSSYTPESSANAVINSRNKSTVENNTYAPNFSIVINGSADPRSQERQVKRWIKESLEETFQSMLRKTPQRA